MAWHGKGMFVDIAALPDDVLDMFMKKANDEIEAENDRYSAHR